MKNALARILLAALCLSLTPAALAQSGKDSPRYKQQHKAAERYQKSLLKQQRNRQKSEARYARHQRKQHSSS